MTIEQLTNNGPDGSTMGQSSTEKISFYGATAIVKATHAGTTTSSTTAQNRVAIAAINTALANLGLVTVT